MALHDLNAAARFAARVAVLPAGRLVALGPPAELLHAGVMREVHGVEAEILAGRGQGPIIVPMAAMARPG